MIRRSIHELGRYVEHARPRYASLAVLSTLVGLTEAAVVVLVVRSALAMTDGTTVAGSVPLIGEVTVGRSLAIALALSGVAIALHVSIARICGDVTSAAVSATRIRLVEAYRDSAWGHQVSGREGDLQHTIGVLAAQSGGVAFGLTNVVTNVLGVGALMAAAAVVDPVATAVVLAFGGLVFVVIWPVRAGGGRLAGSLVRRNADLSHDAAELDRLSLELRTAGVDRRRADDLLDSIGSAATLDRRMRFLVRLGNNLFKDLAIAFLVGLVWIVHVSGGELVAEFGAVVVLVVRAIGNAQAIQNGLQNIDEHAPGLFEFGERLDRWESSNEVVGSDPLEVVDGVEFDRVSFSYDGERRVLDEVSFGIGRGEAVGLVGPSGSGKTTLVQLVLRLRSPQAGEIRFGGLAIDRFDRASFARRVAFVPQEPKLVEGSIADNIRFFRAGISDAQILAAVRRAHLDAVVADLPDGLDTRVTGRTGLSGGQKQRIAIARALAPGPDLLVLDEPTSALDGESEEAIADMLNDLRGEVSILVIAHRPTTVARCDRLVHLEDGRVESMSAP